MTRWPGAVYDEGEEPDPRFSLANERTFLAWLRTALALLAGGVAVRALDLPFEETHERAVGGLLVVLAVVTVAAPRGPARRRGHRARGHPGRRGGRCARADLARVALT